MHTDKKESDSKKSDYIGPLFYVAFQFAFYGTIVYIAHISGCGNKDLDDVKPTNKVTLEERMFENIKPLRCGDPYGI